MIVPKAEYPHTPTLAFESDFPGISSFLIPYRAFRPKKGGKTDRHITHARHGQLAPCGALTSLKPYEFVVKLNYRFDLKARTGARYRNLPIILGATNDESGSIDMHVTSKPNILYFGTPVALLSTLNDDGSPNLSPMSSVVFVSWRAILGLQANSKTVENLRRTGEMVINMPSVTQVGAVNCLAKTTGTFPVPEDKVARGFRYEKMKFEIAGLTEVPSEIVAPPRVLECPVQLEAVLVAERPLDQGGPLEGFLTTFEMRIHRIHVEQSILLDGHENRIDPKKWRPLIFNFQHFYGLGAEVHESKMGEIPEALYRTPDMIEPSAS
jgi:flavin reductase (DIM6/NTAB) family NADH-FMN oxidoreductase RutF